MYLYHWSPNLCLLHIQHQSSSSEEYTMRHRFPLFSDVPWLLNVWTTPSTTILVTPGAFLICSYEKSDLIDVFWSLSQRVYIGHHYICIIWIQGNDLVKNTISTNYSTMRSTCTQKCGKLDNTSYSIPWRKMRELFWLGHGWVWMVKVKMLFCCLTRCNLMELWLIVPHTILYWLFERILHV